MIEDIILFFTIKIKSFTELKANSRLSTKNKKNEKIKYLTSNFYFNIQNTWLDKVMWIEVSDHSLWMGVRSIAFLLFLCCLP